MRDSLFVDAVKVAGRDLVMRWVELVVYGRGRSDDIAGSDRRADLGIEGRGSANYKGHMAVADHKDWGGGCSHRCSVPVVPRQPVDDDDDDDDDSVFLVRCFLIERPLHAPRNMSTLPVDQ